MNASPPPVAAPSKTPSASSAAIKPTLIEDSPEFFPAWLTSFATHLAIFLILLLIGVGGGNGLGNGTQLGVEMQSGGSTGHDEETPEGDNSLAAASELASDIDSQVKPEATKLDPDATTRPLDDLIAHSLNDLPQLELAGRTNNDLPAQGNGNDPGFGAGQGSGQGDDVGDGTGVAGSPGLGIIPARTSIFGLKTEGTRFVYVFDRSESMTSTLTYTIEGVPTYSISPLKAAKAELLRSLKDLGPKHQFQIVFYNHEPLVFDRKQGARPQFLKATPENKHRAARFVDYIEGEGGTYHVDPLEIALNLKPDVIYLLTDGEEKDDPAPYQIEMLKKLNKSHAKINVIQFVLGTRRDGSLAQLAKQSGGKHIMFDIARLGPPLPDAPPVEETPPSEAPAAASAP